MDWVKLGTRYYGDQAVARLDDAAEVMFTRGTALSGEIESSGFVPDELLHTLTRRPQQARRIAKKLCAADLWERVDGGYEIVNFVEWQKELERLVAKKKRDRDRKRAERANRRLGVHGQSVDASADCPPGNGDIESKTKSKTAAAAAVPPQPVENLPGKLQILRGRLEAHKLTVRWDRLTADQVTEIEALIDTHGDGRLVKAAQAAYQPDNPIQFAQGWLSHWRALHPAGLRAVPEPLCEVHPHQRVPARSCTWCAADRKGVK